MTLPRPSIPMRKQRNVAIRQLGLDPKTAELDHDPALGLRERTADGGYDPDANDELFLVWRGPEAHSIKTYGTNATTAGSDIHLMAKNKRLQQAQEDFRRRLLAKDAGEERPRSRWAQKRNLRKQRRGKYG